jgi:hypothetical protein
MSEESFTNGFLLHDLWSLVRVEEDDVIGYRVLHEKLFEVPEPKVGDFRRLGLNHCGQQDLKKCHENYRKKSPTTGGATECKFNYL